MIRKSCEPERRVGPANAPISRKVCAVGSLRNPVGPLPSSIYWRRRVVLVSVAALLALLTTWLVTTGGTGGKDGGNGANGKNPAPSITPGPSSSGPAISQAPGGRDESGDEGSGGSSSGSGAGSGGGSGDGSGGGAGDGSGTGSGGGSGSGGSEGSSGSGGSGGAGGYDGGTTVGGVGAGDTLLGRFHAAQLHREPGQVQLAQPAQQLRPRADAHVPADRAECLRPRLQDRSRSEERRVHDHRGERRRRLLVLQGLPQGHAAAACTAFPRAAASPTP